MNHNKNVSPYSNDTHKETAPPGDKRIRRCCSYAATKTYNHPRTPSPKLKINGAKLTDDT